MTSAALALAAGLFDVGFAAFHLAFWRLFGWPRRLAPLDPVNRSLMPVMNIALTALFTVIGLALALAPEDAATGRTGRWLLLGMTGFWLLRALVQPPYFGLAHPASAALTTLFLLGSALHLAALLA